jgi:cardiolipin synthase
VSGLFKHVPNLLTGMRLACAPALALLLASGADREALGIFALAGLSDAADGYLAKKFGFVTQFGRYLDPAADKLLMFTAFVVLAVMGFAPVWLAVLVIARDVAIVVGIFVGHVLNLPLRVAPLTIGKWSTAIQVGYVGFRLLLLALGLHWDTLALVAACATAGVTIASWIAYGLVLVRAFQARGHTVA